MSLRKARLLCRKVWLSVLQHMNDHFEDFLEFHGMDPEVLQKALHVLVKRGKAQVFGQEDQQGVKFF
jgi:hypothetical protein